MSECCCDDIIIEVNEEGIDGVGIASIELVSTVGITKNYRINLTNGTYFDYSISDGSSIASISKTSSVGLVDTYTVTLTSGETSTFEVTNGNGIASITKTSTENLTDVYTIQYTNGTTSTFSVVNGNSIASVSKVSTQVLTDTYQITYTDEDKSPDTFTVVNGRGITSIAKTSTSGLVDTYTITYNDSSTSTFTVTNGEKGDKGDTGDTGNGIASISLLSESGLVKTYRITMTDGTHFDFDVTDGEKGDTGETGATGNGIASIEKTSTVGLVDTYTITMTDGTTTTFDVTNGSDEWGAIVGNLSDQTDLQTALDSKAPAITETASGPIASFTDGSPAPVTALTVGIEPVQDLHGYDNPWPGGGSKNKLPSVIDGTYSSNGITVVAKNGVMTISGTSTNAVTIDVPFSTMQTFPSSDTYNFYVGNSFQNNNVALYLRRTTTETNIHSFTFTSVNRESTSWTPTSDETFDALRIYANAAGITINGTCAPMLALKTDIPDSWIPYSNICPISGWDEATVTRTGKNILPSTIYNYAVSNNTIVQNANYRSMYCKVISGKTYTVSRNTISGNRFRLVGTAVEPANGVSSTTFISADTTGTLSETITIPEGYNYLLIYLSNQGDTITSNIQVELGSTASSFEPYQPIQTVTIDLDGTRYGGTLDVTTGMLTVDRWVFEPTKPNIISSTDDANYKRARFNVPEGYSIKNNADSTVLNTEVVCNRFKTITAQATYRRTAEGISDGNTNDCVYIFKVDLQTIEQWEAWIANNPLQIVYPLSSPFTVQLSPSQMQTLLGENHVWADTGDTSVEYRADTKLYIQKLTQPTEDDMIANSNIASGKYFMVGNSLYLSSQSIAQGDAIVPGTNCTPTSLAEALNAINA